MLCCRYSAVVDPWIESLWKEVLQLHPLPPGMSVIPNTTLLAAKHKISVVDTPQTVVSEENGSTMHEPGKTPPHGWQSFYATVIGNERITAADHWQDVRLITFDITGSEILYSPGDVLMVRPHNSPDTVAAFIDLMSLDSDAFVTLEAASSHDLWFPPVCTVRELVTKHLDINSLPKRYFWELMSQFTGDELEREKLQEFCTADGQEELYSYCNRPRRTVLEVLHDFPHATSNISLQYLFDMIGPLRPRSFSIASSQKVDKNQIQLVVAVVKYKSKLLVEPRRGVCSTYLASISPNTGEQSKVAVWVERGTIQFPRSLHVPVIMVGPGTGVAPFRSIIHDRASQSASGNYLFFGCRNQNKDFYFRDDWHALEMKSLLRLFTSFSRDQEHKVYVQHMLAEQADLIWTLISQQGAWFYIAGNAKNMPDSVRAEMKKIVMTRGEKTENEADRYLDELDRTRRYQCETWS